MKKQLKLLINDLSKTFELVYNNYKNVKDDSIYLSVFFAIVSLKHKKDNKLNFNRENYLLYFKEELDLLETKFPNLLNVFKKVDANFEDKNIKEKIFIHIINIFKNTDENIDNLISWMFQFIRNDLKKIAFKKNKIIDNDVLYATQFFTDNYMVKFIVDKSFDLYDNQDFVNLKIIDCASGGGNFLTYAFDKLFKEIKKLNPTYSNVKIVDYILNNKLVGYDLDSELSEISSLSLFVKACNYAVPSHDTNIFIFGGIKKDKLGYLKENIISNIIDKLNFQSIINDSESKKIFITNPPFMGKRNMDVELKNNITKMFPNSKGDLCTTFLEKITKNMSDNDTLGIVSQNNWMYLDSLNIFRKEFLQNMQLVYCVDLGSNSFEDINGEKTNVALSIITKKTKFNNKKTKFVDLRNYPIEYKKKISEIFNQKENSFVINQNKFLENSNFEFNYRLKLSFENILNLPKYSNYAKPMQGTSTGNNKKFIKYIWEVNGLKDWKYVSKGGGFSKWSGLNYHMVYWGVNGEKVKENKGSALRNINEIPYTDLVYSDTGTLGLNIRILKPNQLFIASGPGIKIINGDKYCHLAFLNSKMSTFLLKFINPKFTISAGYISKLNIANNILDSNLLSEKSKKCLNLKEKFLTTKLPNFEFIHSEYSDILDLNETLSNNIINDLEIEYKILKLESQIENMIQEQYKLTSYQIEEINSTIGKSIFQYDKKNKEFNMNEVDTFYSNSLNINCMVSAKSLKNYKIGSEFILEHLCFKYSAHPDSILKTLKENIIMLEKTRNKYMLDLIHKIILKELDITNLYNFTMKEITIHELNNILLDKYPFLRTIDFIDEHISNILIKHHKNSFLNKPIFKIKSNQIILKRIDNE